MAGYIGNFPTAIPLTSSDLTDGLVTTSKLANDAVDNTKLDLTDNYAFTGDISGTPYDAKLFHVRDEKTSGTNGGSSTGSADNDRDLNTVKTNEISGASLSSNQVTLPAGTYYVNASAPAYKTNGHRLVLYNISDGANAIIGTNAFANNADNGFNRSYVIGRFTLSGSKTLKFITWTDTGQATNGLGVQEPSDSRIEVYTDAQFWKVG